MPSETHHGIQGIDISTAGFLFNPQEAFLVTNELNRNRTKEDWVQLEVYPFTSIPGLDNVVSSAIYHNLNPSQPFDPEVTTAKVRAWQKDYPNTKINRIHLPFGYDDFEVRKQALMPTFQSLKLRFKTNIHHTFYALYLGSALNNRGIDLAKSLSDQEVGLTVHANVAYRYAKDGRIPNLTDGIPSVLIENSPKFKYGRIKPIETAFIPNEVVSKIIKPNSHLGVSGLLLGTEHLGGINIKAESLLLDPEITSHMQAIHLAGDQHESIDVKLSSYRRLLVQLRQTEFTHPVRAVLDYNPFELLGLSIEEKIKLFRENIAQIMVVSGNTH